MITEWHFFYDQDDAGHYEKLFAKSSYDLEALRIAISQNNFRGSRSKYVKQEDDLDFRQKIEVIRASIDEASSSDEPINLMSLAISLVCTCVSIQLVDPASAVMGSAALLMLFMSFRTRVKFLRSRLSQGLNILLRESKDCD